MSPRVTILTALTLPAVLPAVTIQIVADNDFAILVGNADAPMRLAYQNNVVWNDQITAAASYNLTFAAGETTVYLLAMGGGGQENISGRIDGVDITTLLGVQVSSNIAGGLSGYNSTTVTDGSYSAQFADVVNSLATATWSAPVIGTGTVISLSGNAQGYVFPDNNAVVYRFAAQQVGGPVPEPSTYGLILGGLALAGATLRRRRRKTD